MTPEGARQGHGSRQEQFSKWSTQGVHALYVDSCRSQVVQIPHRRAGQPVDPEETISLMKLFLTVRRSVGLW